MVAIQKTRTAVRMDKHTYTHKHTLACSLSLTRIRTHTRVHARTHKGTHTHTQKHTHTPHTEGSWSWTRWQDLRGDWSTDACCISDVKFLMLLCRHTSFGHSNRLNQINLRTSCVHSCRRQHLLFCCCHIDIPWLFSVCVFHRRRSDA